MFSTKNIQLGKILDILNLNKKDDLNEKASSSEIKIPWNYEKKTI